MSSLYLDYFCVNGHYSLYLWIYNTYIRRMRIKSFFKFMKIYPHVCITDESIFALKMKWNLNLKDECSNICEFV